MTRYGDMLRATNTTFPNIKYSNTGIT
jgi:hypothetical protein